VAASQPAGNLLFDGTMDSARWGFDDVL